MSYTKHRRNDPDPSEKQIEALVDWRPEPLSPREKILERKEQISTLYKINF